METKIKTIETYKFNITVSDEQIKENDYVYHLSRTEVFKVHHFSESNGSVSFFPSDKFGLSTSIELLLTDCVKVESILIKNDEYESIKIEDKVDIELLAETKCETYLEKIKDISKRWFWKVGFKVGYKEANKMYSEQDMIMAAKYGYEFRDTTSFPEHKFEDSCINNFKQKLKSLKQI